VLCLAPSYDPGLVLVLYIKLYSTLLLTFALYRILRIGKKKQKNKKQNEKQQQKKKQPTPLELFLHVKRRTLKSLFKK